MTAVSPGNSTVAFIRTKVRRLTACSGESALTTADLDQYINNFYNNDFAYAIKIDQMRSVYTFFTEPYIDRYPLDVNFNQGVRAPVYVEGIQGTFFKDRQQYYNLWPRFPTFFQMGGSTTTGTITGITNANPGLVTSPNHNLTTGAVITISDVSGMTQLNGNIYTITVVDVNDFNINIDTTLFGIYTSGGSWISNNQTFSFTIAAPFLSKEVVLGGVDAGGNPITINDDGNGNLLYLVPNPVVYTPLQNVNPAIPGMYNRNNSNPGLNNPTIIGTVNYVSGQMNFTLPAGVSLGSGELFTIWVSQYQTGRPYSLLFWNNEFTIRPVPKYVHKVEVETYLTPVQFMNSTDNPILTQWSQYIAYGTALEILRDRQDMEGVQNLMEGFKRQEALVLERQGIEEINTPTYQFFNSTQTYWINGGFSQGGFFG
jgi:Ubiquitin-activating enzyme E1 FCCH domain